MLCVQMQADAKKECSLSKVWGQEILGSKADWIENLDEKRKMAKYSKFEAVTNKEMADKDCETRSCRQVPGVEQA
jgi:hypothetical protein